MPSRRLAPNVAGFPMTPPVPERPALFLDFDGTLVEIADRPDAVVVAPMVPGLIEHLVKATGGAVAVISGRRIEEIDAFLHTAIAAAGMHGSQRRAEPGAEVAVLSDSPQVAQLRQRLHDSGLIGGPIRLEDKGAGIAVHYRAAPDRGDEVSRRMEEAIADLDDLNLLHGKMVVEAKRKGFDKGAAVRGFMEHAPFEGRTPVFLGDDVTDEDGIKACNDLGGFGVKVGEGETAAKYRVDDVAAIIAWLSKVADTVR